MKRGLCLVLLIGALVGWLPSEAQAGQKQRWWLHGVSIGGIVGTWGGVPLAGLRGALPLGERLSLRLGWALFFDLKDNKQLSYNKLSLDLLIRFPSPINSIRYYALTRLDFWPLLDTFGVNPRVKDISKMPTFGLSMLLGVESFLIPGFSLVLETGFSSGMLLGFAEIEQRYQSFAFVIQTGMQLYF